MSDDKRNYSLFPKTLASVVEPLTRPALKSRGLANAKIIAQWSSIVGDALASHCYPEKLSFPRGKTTGGTLTIAVENGFATHIQHMSAAIIERLDTFYGYRAVERISISHSYSRPPAATAARKPPALPETCCEAAAQANDPQLREALESLAKTLSGKGQ